MNRFFLNLCLWAAAACFAACSEPPPIESEEVAQFAIPPDRAFLAKRLVADVGIMKPLDQGWVVSGTQINVVEVSFPLMKEADVPDGAVGGRVILSPAAKAKAKAKEGQRRSKSFLITLENATQDPMVDAHLERIAQSVERLDTGDFYRIESAWRSDGRPGDGPSMTRNLGALIDRHAQPLGAMLALVLAWLALWTRMRRRSMDFQWLESARPTHLLPVALQLTLFIYWGLHDLSVGELLGDLVVQVAFAYGLEAWFLAWRNNGKVQIGASVLPIVGSMNLFVWFLGQDRWVALLTLTLAIASKHLIRRHGRHVFNPSALGIAITGALCMVAPETFGFFDLSHGFNAGPNMVELILILALIAQLRLPIVLVSMGGFIALLLLVDTQILSRPTALWGPVFLALCLLITDPATIPKTPVGKLLFGAVYGSLMAVMATGLTAMGENDFFSKVFPLPVVNALVPRFDRWGSRASTWTRGVLEPVHNRAHVGVWLILVLGVLFGTDAKVGGFEHNRFDATLCPRVTVGPEGAASCADNPAHCEPFSLDAELALWSQPPVTPPEAHRDRELPMNRSAMGILFLLLAALVAWLLDLPHAARDLGVRGAPGARATVLWLLGLCGVGLAVRLAVDPMFIREAFPLLPIPPFLDARLLGEAIDVYPQAPHLMAAALAPWLSSDPVSSWFTSNVIYGTLTIPAIFVLGAAASGRARVGLFAAALLAFWPQHIRVSASESAHVSLVLWATVAAAWSILAARSGRLSAFAAAITASCVLVMTRPEAALWGVALMPLLLFSHRGVRDRVLYPSRLLFIAAGVWMVFPFLLATAKAPQAARLSPGSGMGESVDGSSLGELLWLLVTPDSQNAFFDAHTTPLWLWPLAVVGVFVGARRVGRATLLPFVAVALSYLLLYAEMREAGVVWTKARYHAAALPAVALLAAWGLEDLLARVPLLAARGRRVGAVVALCALGIGPWWPGGGSLPMDWQRELSWLHELGTRDPPLLEQGARVVTPDNRRRFLDQSPRSRVQLLTGGAQHADKAIPIVHALERLEPMRLSTSVYYYRGLYCYLAVAPDGTEPFNPQCDAMERAFELEPIALKAVDAPVYQQAYVGVRVEGPLELGLFKVVRRRLAADEALRGFPEAITAPRTDVFPMGTNTPPETMEPRPPLVP